MGQGLLQRLVTQVTVGEVRNGMRLCLMTVRGFESRWPAATLVGMSVKKCGSCAPGGADR